MVYHAFKAAVHLLESRGVFVVGNTCSDPDEGWIDVYSFEPPAECRRELEKVVTAIKPFVNVIHDWSFRLFTEEGLFICSALGKRMDEDDCPIDDTNAFGVAPTPSHDLQHEG